MRLAPDEGGCVPQAQVVGIRQAAAFCGSPCTTWGFHPLKMVDYSRFDGIEDSDEEDEEKTRATSNVLQRLDYGSADGPGSEVRFDLSKVKQKFESVECGEGYFPPSDPRSLKQSTSSTVEEFLALEPHELAPSKRCSSHLHLDGRRQTLDVGPPARTVSGVVVGTNYIMFTLCVGVALATSQNVFPALLQKLCESYLKMHREDPRIGRPVCITTPEPTLAQYLNEWIGGSGTVVQYVDPEMAIVKIGSPPHDPLVAVMDALAVEMDEGRKRSLEGKSTGVFVR